MQSQSEFRRRLGPFTLGYRPVRPLLILVPFVCVLLWQLVVSHKQGGGVPFNVSSYLPVYGPTFDPGAHHVFIATNPPWHEGVWLWLAGMMTRLGVDHTLFTECDGHGRENTCVRFNLLELAEEIGLWSGELYQKSELFERVNEPLPDGSLVDTIIFATEKDDLAWSTDRLLELWHARPADQKFKVIAVYHEPTGMVEHWATRWGPTGALSFLTLSPHVNTELLRKLSLSAATFDYSYAGVEHTLARSIVLWLPVEEYRLYTPAEGQVARAEHDIVSRVVINGMISPERRSYDRTFNDLRRQLELDPALWGYWFNEESEMYEAIDPTDPSTFKLIVLGERDARYEGLPDPGNVANAVEYVVGYEQTQLYTVMSSADLLLTAWNSAFRYLDSQASSSAFTTLEVEVPLLTTSIVTARYTFLDPSISVIRPNALSEIDTVGVFRRFPDAEKHSVGELELMVAALYPDPSHPHLIREIAQMLKQGWKRSRKNWRTKKAQLEAANLETLKDALDN